MSMHVAMGGTWLGIPSGANRRMLGLLEAMRALLHEGEQVTVLHGRGYAPPWQHPRVHWHAVDLDPQPPTLARAWFEWRSLPRLLRRLDVDLLDHAMLPLPRAGVPSVLTVHDTRDVDGHSHRPAWLARMLLQDAVRRASALVAVSRFTAARIHAHVQAAETVVIPNAPSLPVLPRAAVADLVLHVGHLEPRKNLSLLLDGFARLDRERRRQLRVVLVGADAGSRASLQARAAALGILERVDFAGALPDEALPALYARAAAVCVPSHHEGSGICALEGLAAGAPVLVSANSGMAELAQLGAIALPPDDSAAWADAIAEAEPPASPPLVPGWDAPARQLLDVWRSAHGRHRQPGKA